MFKRKFPFRPRDVFHASLRILFVALAAILCSSSTCRPPRPAPAGTGGGVHGFVFARVETAAKVKQIFLPGITVYLKNVATSALGPKITTDLHGRFVIPRQPAGTYQLCWEAPGFVAGCNPDAVLIQSVTMYPLPVEITPERGMISGRVTLADGTACRYVDNFFGINVHTTVSLLDNTGADVTHPVLANVFGYYLLTKAPAGAFRVQATCETSKAEQKLTTTGSNVVNLTFRNFSPTISTVVGSLGGQGVRLVPAGATVRVTVNANDRNGDSIHYKWATTTPGFTSTDSPTVDWTLPNSKGLHTLYVQTSDGKGGYRTRRVAISTDIGIVFSGTVRGSDGPFIENAEVSVNGQATKTNAEGYFVIVLPKESPRYVLQVQKQSYALLSKVFYEKVIGGKYRLNKAFQTLVDPNGPIEVMEKRERREFGTLVQIPARSLVNSNGILATNPVNLYLHTIDLRDPDNPFPGDYTGQDTAGRFVTMVSFGAVDINIMDAGGNRYNLAPGKKAIVSIPVDPGQLASPGGPPQTIPLWWYDTKTGVWLQEGTAKLAGNFYRGEVTHFSTLNVDVAFTDAACMRILIDETTLQLPVNLRVTVPTGTGLDKIKTTTLNDSLSAITRLPANSPIKLNVLDSTLNVIALGEQTVNSGAGIPGTADPSPPYPYSVCNSEATLTIGLPQNPPFAYPAGEFHFLIREGIDDATSAANYYSAIDPTNAKTTFTAWKLANGLADNPDANNNGNDFDDDAATGEVSAAYENAADLGFGRAMHAKKAGNDLAFYVCNYPTVDEARLDINLIACVAMEYSAAPLASRFTKFYVFANNNNRLASAELDNRGQKFVPGLCLTCHAGTYNNPEPVAASGTVPGHNRFRAGESPDQGSQFLPFDLDNFGYSGIVGFRRQDQQGKFRDLNLRVRDTNPLASITDVVNGWYPGGAGNQNTGFVPPGWATPAASADLYSRVVKPACRTCHVAQDGIINWTQSNDFDSFSGFIKTLVCEERVMPHAIVTFNRFWLSQNPNQPATLGAAGLSGWPANYPCPCGGSGEPPCPP